MTPVFFLIFFFCIASSLEKRNKITIRDFFSWLEVRLIKALRNARAAKVSEGRHRGMADFASYVFVDTPDRERAKEFVEASKHRRGAPT